MAVSAREKWCEHVRAWRASGDTAAVYCERAGVNPRTLVWWASKLRNEKAPPDQGSPRAPARENFVEVTSLEAAHVASFELEVASILVRVPFDVDAPALRRLLDMLEARR
jgi:hypothetical protein